MSASYGGSELATFACKFVRFGPSFIHITTGCLSLSFPCSHHQLAAFGIRFIIHVMKRIVDIRLKQMEQTVFQMFYTLFFSHDIGMLLLNHFKASLNPFTFPLHNSVKHLHQGVKRFHRPIDPFKLFNDII